mmetsp:Transcript_160268/g.283997  ORF Transcript_160268/g.283997 Transcript_160268/m.283997 type:complete len:551 (-) Transcript_160268:42-1694(-)
MRLQLSDEVLQRVLRSLGTAARGPLLAACRAAGRVCDRSGLAPCGSSTQPPAPALPASGDIPEPPDGYAVRKTRLPRLAKKTMRFCRFGCCCGDNDSILLALEADSQTRLDIGEIPVVLAAASFDGCRAAAYVDSHVHLEVVLQIIRTRERVPSLNKKWRELAREERRLWRILGWTRTQFDSQPKLENPIWTCPWETLSTSEIDAARALGWDHEKWSSWDWPLPRHVDWEDLGEETRLHLGTLGETCDSWADMFDRTDITGAGDGGDGREWNELTEEEAAAASKLGFNDLTFSLLDMGNVDFFIDKFCGSGFEGCITSGCDDYSLSDAVKLTLAHPKVFGAFGCHPKTAWLYNDTMEAEILDAFSSCGRKAVAWGECGLDYSLPSWGTRADYRLEQIRVLERQLDLALERGLPLVLHIRNGDEDDDAAQDSLRILRQRVPKHWKAHVHGNHCPSLVEMMIPEWPNFFFGLTATVTMGGSGPGTGVMMAHTIPVERMLLETDAPFIVPRGTFFNHSGQIPHIARSIAQLRGCSAHEIMTVARANTRFVYGI